VAVALVDYRGSTGHGRHFRRLLDGAWGVADAEDCCSAATFLAGAGLVDESRMVVKGASAGGLTALRCLDAGGPFAAAVVAYGVTDLGALAADTHKFESRYLDGLVGPWPEAAAVYEDRSPARHPERLEGAVLLLQGSDDPIVPPDQAERMVAALRGRGVRCDHVVFPGEGHGFRRAETLARCAELEIAFVRDVLGIEMAS
jgi:dipeptidyl aminopeptidase/acylaminoacyl peptidase